MELNNRHSEAAAAERDEVERILRALSQSVGTHAAAVVALVEAAAQSISFSPAPPGHGQAEEDLDRDHQEIDREVASSSVGPDQCPAPTPPRQHRPVELERTKLEGALARDRDAGVREAVAWSDADATVADEETSALVEQARTGDERRP